MPYRVQWNTLESLTGMFKPKGGRADVPKEETSRGKRNEQGIPQEIMLWHNIESMSTSHSQHRWFTLLSHI